MGFPTRDNRTSYGPHYEDVYPVRDASTEVGQQVLNKLFWNDAGKNRVTPVARWLCSISGSTITTEEQGLAWDANSGITNITFTYEARGWYSFQLASTYPDEQGQSIATSLTHAIAYPAQDSGGSGVQDGGDNQAILTDSGAAWTPSAFIGYTVYNLTDGSKGSVTANTATTVTATLSGGTDNDWDNDDQYLIFTGAAYGLVYFINGYTGAVYFFDSSGTTIDPAGFAILAF